MPIQLNTITASNVVKPKWFWDNLTGSGTNNIGVLGIPNFPKNSGYEVKSLPYIPTNNYSGEYKQENVTIKYWNFTFIDYLLNQSTIMNKGNILKKIYDLFDDDLKTDHMCIIPTHIRIISTKMQDNTYDRKTRIEYAYIYCKDNSDPITFGISEPDLINDGTKIADQQKSHIDHINTLITKDHLVKINNRSLFENLNTFHLFEGLYKIFKEHVLDISETIMKSTDKSTIIALLDFLSNVDTDLSVYHFIYKLIEENLSEDALVRIQEQNVYMLMYKTLEDLKKTKETLSPLNLSVLNKQINGNDFNAEQTESFAATSPYTLIQAGAGTGKSTILLERIKTLENNGYDSDKICVLSFTNVAANHIKDNCPYVYSSTIASFICDIYAENFGHVLTDEYTMIDMLTIWINKNMGQKSVNTGLLLKNKLQQIIGKEKDPNNIMHLLSFIHENIDEVLDILNEIKMTTLTLQPIIIYLFTSKLKMPNGLKFEHILIDEVQDTNIFEFITILTFAIYNKTTLYMVGDCSQTLYEFRAANPDAINILEASDIFETHPLQINYRSKQDILSFANETLKNVKANKFANIQLYSNENNNIDINSFKDRIDVKPVNLSQKEFNQQIGVTVGTDIKDYIMKHKGEQVAILAYANNTLNLITHAIKNNPALCNLEINDIRNKRNTPTTLFSSFIAEKWDRISFVSIQNIHMYIKKAIELKIESLPDSKKYNANKLLESFNTDGLNISNRINSAYQNGSITEERAKTLYKNLLLQLQQKQNAVKQWIQKQVEKNPDQGDIVISTIHSSKGLEWDNVVIIYDGDSELTTSEEQKRLWYVALTRAKKSELIIARSTITTPMLVLHHKNIIESLNQNNIYENLNNIAEVNHANAQ